MSAMVQCFTCKRFYKNKKTLRAHERYAGHPVLETVGNNTNASLEDSAKLKAEITAKLADIAQLQDVVKTKDADLATLHDEIAKLASEEHETDVVRERLRGLTREGYVQLGESLGYLDKIETATVEDSETATPVAEHQEPKVKEPPAETAPADVVTLKAETAPIAPLAPLAPLATLQEDKIAEPPEETEYDKFWRELNEMLSKEK